MSAAEWAAREQFYANVRAVVLDHYSGLSQDVPSEHVWARLDAVLFEDDGISRVEPDFAATTTAAPKPLSPTKPSGPLPASEPDTQ
jgi:hypothetical protein